MKTLISLFLMISMSSGIQENKSFIQDEELIDGEMRTLEGVEYDNPDLLMVTTGQEPDTVPEEVPSSIWNEGTEWNVFYTEHATGGNSSLDESYEIRENYSLKKADDGYMALERAEYINNILMSQQLQGYIRNANDTAIYVRPILNDGSIGKECLLYDFRVPFEYGHTIRYGVMGGEIREEAIDWQEDSLEYYMLNNGDKHCLPAWKGIVYKYGFIGGPMDLFLMQETPSNNPRPKASNISHVIFTTKKNKKSKRMNTSEEEERNVIIPYDEMLTTGKRWECFAISRERTEDRTTYTIQIQRDTLIGIRRCKQIYAPKYNIRMTVFEEGRKVYIVNSNNTPELLLDFGLQKGDCINEVEWVENVDTLESQGYSYNIITINSGTDCSSFLVDDPQPWNYYLIEGIGVSKGQFLTGHRFLEAEKTYSYLLRCWQDDALIYVAPGVNDIQHVTLSNASPTYDPQGRRLRQKPQKGIYIKDGKKYIINR